MNFKRRIHPYWCSLLFILLISQTTECLYAQSTKRVYLIGNSVTDAINYSGLDALAESQGNTHIWGRQMIPGAPLEWLWGHPNDGFTEQPFGYPTNAFANYTWDAISLQPFDRQLDGDLGIIGQYIDLARGNSPGVQIYIYSRWPRNPYGDDANDTRLTASVWNQQWDRTYTGGWDGTNESRDYFVDLTNAVRNTHTSVKPALMVPVGQVFQALNNKMAAGQVPGFSSIWKVYSDGIHMTSTGSYIAAVTYFTTLYGQDPRGLGVPSQFGTISAEVAQIIQQTVWDVVTSEPLSGVTDDGGSGPTLRNPENPANTEAGLDYTYHEGSWSALPDFVSLTPTETGTVSTFDITPRNRNDNFGFRYNGYINIPTDGTYTFYTSSDDGSKLYIGTTTVVDNDGLHANQERSGTIGLKAGKHAISVVFFEAGGGEVLAASYEGPGISKQIIPASALFRVPSTSTPNNPPTAVLSATPEAGTAPLTVTFDASGSSDPDANDFILGYDWNFGDSNTSNANAPTHTYTTPGTYTVTLRVMDNRNLYSSPVTKTITVTAPPSNETYLSDLTPTASTNGWGPQEKDKSNGESAANDGNTITLNGTTYSKGLGVHANSSVTYTLGGSYTTFTSDIGLDDEIGSNGSVVFQVYLDGNLAYNSPTLTGSSAVQNVSVNVSGKNELRLVVTDAGDGLSYDHADWAGARLQANNVLSGVLLANDDFNVATGALHGKASGSGWSSAWITQNEDATIPGYNIANTSSLQYGNIATTGNYATGGTAYLTAGRGFDVSTSGAFGPYVSNGNIGVNGEEIYFSALLLKQQNNTEEAHLTLHAGTIAWNASAPLVSIGYFGTPSDNNGNRYWSLRVGTTVYRTNEIITAGQPALLVGKIAFGATNTISLYVNPESLGGAAPSSADASTTTTSTVGFKSLAYYAGTSPNQSAVDEIRVGDSFAAVTPTGNTNPGDTQSPAAPSGLASTGQTANSVSLNWSAATDNVGVTAYLIYHGTNLAATTTSTSHTVSNLSPGVSYTFTVKAQDAAGNISTASNAITVTTQTGSGTADATLTLDATTQYQTMDGFGFFGAKDVWWGSGDASHFYSDAWLDKIIGDLGITIWRNELYPHNPPDQHTLNDQDADWNKQRPMVQALKAKADQYGVDLKVVLTVWSPPGSYKWWSQFAWPGDEAALRGPSGEGDYWWEKTGGTLNPNKYNDFADWLIQGIQMYKDLGINVYAISPQNEPAFSQSFNSCTYTTQWYADMIKAVAPIVKTSHPGIQFFGSENMLEMEGADHNWQWFYTNKLKNDANAMNAVDILAYHGYSDGVNASSGSNLARYWANTWNIFAQPAGKKQWMTETSGYVDTWESTNNKPGAFNLAMDIYSALNYGNVSGWVWWQGSEQNSSIGEYALMSESQSGKKYYASKQYYKFIRPNAVRVKSTSSDTTVFALAFKNATSNTNTVLILNASSVSKTVSLSAVGGGWPSSYEMFVTSATQNCISTGNVSASDVITLPARSVVTLNAGGSTLQRATMAASASSVEMFPNPASHSVNIKIDESEGTKAHIKISDYMNQTVLQEERLLNKGKNTIELNTAGLKEGLYILTIEQGGKKTESRLVIKK